METRKTFWDAYDPEALSPLALRLLEDLRARPLRLRRIRVTYSELATSLDVDKTEIQQAMLDLNRFGLLERYFNPDARRYEYVVEREEPHASR